MANTIKIKAGSGTPTTSDIVDKELAFDRSANKLYINDSGTIVDLTGSAATGDITAVTAGTGLDGGGSSGDVTLSVDVSDFMSNGADNRVLTATGTDAMNAEANLTFDGTHLYLPDSSNIKFGDSQDLEIKHDGSNSIIKADGTGDLTIRQDTADKDILLRSDDGSGGIETYLMLDGSASRLSIPSDNIKLTIGAGADLKTYHDGTNSYITNATGRLIISQQTDDSFIDFKCDDGSGGVATYLSLNGANTRIDVSKNILFDDSVSASFGDGSDLQLFHNGTRFSTVVFWCR